MADPQSPQEYYLETSRITQEDARRDSAALDKMVLTLATGSIALSIGFFSSSQEKGRELHYLWLLLLSWAFLLFCLGIQILTYWLAVQVSILKLRLLDEWKAADYNPPFFNPNQPQQNQISRLNVISLVLLSLGLLFMVIFASVNMTINNKVPSTSVEIKAPVNIVQPYNEPAPSTQIQPTSPMPAVSVPDGK